MASLHYGFGGEQLKKVYEQMPHHIEHIEMASLHYGFGGEQLKKVYEQMPYHSEHIEMASLHYEQLKTVFE